MLSFASDFWPLFWTVIGAGVALTVLVCVAIATAEPAWPARSQTATVHHLPRRHAPDATSRKAA
jgi:hypothetical protein